MSEINDAEGTEADAVDDAGIDDEEMWNETVTNDAVAGETVLPGAGDGNWGPTGGSPGEQEPEAATNDLAGQPIDLDDDDRSGQR